MTPPRRASPMFALIQTAEKLPQRRAAGGQGTGRTRIAPAAATIAIVHLSRAVEKIAMWDPPMRFNDTTRYYFEKLAGVSSPEEAARYNALFDPEKSAGGARISGRDMSPALLDAAHLDFAQHHSAADFR